MSIDLASIRAGIANILSGIPEIQRVNVYPNSGESANNLPFATIFRGPIQGPGGSLQGEDADTQLGGYDHLITWTIRIYQNLLNVDDAQMFDDIIAQRLFDAFNAPSARLIDPNGPGVVDWSRLTLVTPFMQDEDHPALWIAEASLQTFVIATA